MRNLPLCILLTLSLALASCASRTPIVTRAGMEQRPVLRVGEAAKVNVSVVGRSELWTQAVAASAGGVIGATIAHGAQSRRSANRTYNVRGRAMDQRLSAAGVNVAAIVRRACERQLAPVSGLPASGNTLDIRLTSYSVSTVSKTGFANKARPSLSVKASLIAPNGNVLKKGTYLINGYNVDIVPTRPLADYSENPAIFRSAIEKYAALIASKVIE